jgi:hypothetical protein
MARDDYKKALEVARVDLEKLMEYREDVDRKILQLRKSIVALAPLAGENELLEAFQSSIEEVGLTDNCRDVLKANKKPLTAIEVRTQLEALGYKFKSSNPLATIHAVLKRLVASNQVVTVTTGEGDTAYKWILRFPRIRYRRRINNDQEEQVGGYFSGRK